MTFVFGKPFATRKIILKLTFLPELKYLAAP